MAHNEQLFAAALRAGLMGPSSGFRVFAKWVLMKTDFEIQDYLLAFKTFQKGIYSSSSQVKSADLFLNKYDRDG